MADAVLLVSINVQSKDVKLLAIPRETVIPVKVFDRAGNFVKQKINRLHCSMPMEEQPKTAVNLRQRLYRICCISCPFSVIVPLILRRFLF